MQAEPVQTYVLRCGKCGVNNPDTRPRHVDTNERRFRRGEALTMMELMTLSRTLSNRMRREEARTGAVDPKTMALWEEVEMAQGSNSKEITVQPVREVVTEEQAVRFLDMANLGRMTPAVRDMALEVMRLTGLNPALREITIYEGALYVMADGYRKLLNKSGTFDGMPEPPHYLSADEKAAQGYSPSQIVVRVALQRKGQRFPVYAIGVADPKNPLRNNPVEKTHPQVMAETRAYRRAARAGWQDVLSGYGLDYDPEEEQPERRFGASAADAEPDVDVITGEILPDAGLPMQDYDAAPTDDADETDRTETPADRLVREGLALGWSVDQIEKSARTWFGGPLEKATDAQVESVLAMLRKGGAAAARP